MTTSSWRQPRYPVPGKRRRRSSSAQRQTSSSYIALPEKQTPRCVEKPGNVRRQSRNFIGRSVPNSPRSRRKCSPYPVLSEAGRNKKRMNAQVTEQINTSPNFQGRHAKCLSLRHVHGCAGIHDCTRRSFPCCLTVVISIIFLYSPKAAHEQLVDHVPQEKHLPISSPTPRQERSVSVTSPLARDMGSFKVHPTSSCHARKEPRGKQGQHDVAIPR